MATVVANNAAINPPTIESEIELRFKVGFNMVPRPPKNKT